MIDKSHIFVNQNLEVLPMTWWRWRAETDVNPLKLSQLILQHELSMASPWQYRGEFVRTLTLFQENQALSECHIGFLGGPKICPKKGLTSCCTPKPAIYCMHFWPQALIPLWLVKGCSSSTSELWKNKASVKGTYVWPFLADAKKTYHPVAHLKKWHSFSLVNYSTAETIWFITKLGFHELH